MKLHVALRQMAELMVSHDRLHHDARIRFTPRPEGPASAAMQKADEAMHEISRQITELSERCAANPLLHAHMMCWMVDIVGQSDVSVAYPVGSPQAAKALQELTTDPAAFAARHGSLMSAVRGALEDQGLTITVNGGGGGRWDLGVPCDDVGAAAVCHLMHSRFGPAINAGIIVVRRRFWKWRFRQLFNVQDAMEYLKRPR